MIAELASWLRDARITDRPWKLREVEVQMQSLETHFAAAGVAALPRSLTDVKVSTQPDRFDDQHSIWRPERVPDPGVRGRAIRAHERGTGVSERKSQVIEAFLQLVSASSRPDTLLKNISHRTRLKVLIRSQQDAAHNIRSQLNARRLDTTVSTTKEVYNIRSDRRDRMTGCNTQIRPMMIDSIGSKSESQDMGPQWRWQNALSPICAGICTDKVAEWQTAR